MTALLVIHRENDYVDMSAVEADVPKLETHYLHRTRPLHPHFCRGSDHRVQNLAKRFSAETDERGL